MVQYVQDSMGTVNLHTNLQFTQSNKLCSKYDQLLNNSLLVF